MSAHQPAAACAADAAVLCVIGTGAPAAAAASPGAHHARPMCLPRAGAERSLRPHPTRYSMDLSRLTALMLHKDPKEVGSGPACARQRMRARVALEVARTCLHGKRPALGPRRCSKPSLIAAPSPHPSHLPYLLNPAFPHRPTPAAHD